MIYKYPSLMALFTSGVHQRVLGLPPRLAPVTLLSQLPAATFTMAAQKHGTLRSHAPHYLRDVVEALMEMGIEDHFHRTFSQALQADPHYSPGPASSVQYPASPLDPTQYQVDLGESSGPLITRVSSIYGHRSDDMSTK